MYNNPTEKVLDAVKVACAKNKKDFVYVKKVSEANTFLFKASLI